MGTTIIRLGTASTGIPTPSPFDEACAPLRQAFEESGMTDEELLDLIEQERQAIWDEKHRSDPLT